MGTKYINDSWRMPRNANTDKVSNFSLNFGGVSDWIVLDNNTLLNGKTAFSLSVWVYPTATQQLYAGIIGYHTANDEAVKLHFGGTPANNQVTIGVFEPGNTAITTSSVNSVPLNTWTHIVVVGDASLSNVNLYINGTLDNDSVSGNMTSISQGSDFYIGTGSGATTSREFQGRISSVSIFDYALSTTQITTLYGNSTDGVGSPMSLSPLPKSYYQLGDLSAWNGSEYLQPNSALKDYVFDFDGTNDYIEVANNSSLQLTDNLTLSCWINADNVSGTNSIIDKFYDGADRSYMLRLESTRIKLSLGNTDGSASVTYQSSATLSNNTWYHIAVTFSTGSQEVNIYIDGQGDSTHSKTDLISSNNEELRIGTGYNLLNYFDGKLSNVQIWDTELSVGNVTTLYNNGTPYTGTQPQAANLQGWWKLDASATYDGTDWSVPDASSNSNTGTSSGMTTANLIQSDLTITSSDYADFSLDFDGTNDYINISDVSDIATNTQGSISFWINFPGDSSTRYAFGISDTNADIFLTIGINLYENLDIILRNTGPNIWRLTTSGSPIVLDTWQHICLTQDGTACEVYVNGIKPTQSGAGTEWLNDLTGLDLLTIGALYKNSALQPIECKISNVSIWDTGLNSTQVTELYNSGLPSNLNNHSLSANLVSWWQLGRNTSFNGTDWTCLDEISASGNNGVSVNMDQDDLVDGVGMSSSGTSSGFAGDEIKGDSPYSDANALSVNLQVDGRVTSTP
jgi:hypothetical protein